MINEERLKQYCKSRPELIENFKLAEEDLTQTWDCHHRLETHFKNGKFREKQLTSQDLKDRDLYFRRPASELIFLTHSEHIRLHAQNRTEEHKKKISESLKEKEPWNKGKHLPEETKKKLSESHKGNTIARGRRWYNNGLITVMRFECPEGFIPGRLKRTPALIK